MAVSPQVEQLNRVRYTGLDFDTHFDDLRGRAQVEFAEDFNDFALSSLGIMLIDLVAYGLDSLSFYLDRRASDAYLDTARTRKAVARLSRQLGYKMGAAVSSSVDLSVAVADSVAFSVPVPKGFQFKGPDDLIFETAETVTFDPNAGPTDFKIFPCYEGETVTENFVSTGATNQTFQLRRVPDAKAVVQGTVLVFVNGGEWTESEFLSFDKTDQFEVGYNDDPTTIRFGDGVAGNIPPVSAPIVVTYVASRGRSGQVGADTIQEVVTPLVVNFTTIELVVNNPEAAEGGDDAEDLAKVQAFAGRVFNSRKVAVTLDDYKALAGSFADPLYGRVAAAQAISSRSAAQDIYLLNSLAAIRNLLTPVRAEVNGLTADSSRLSGILNFSSGATGITGAGTSFLSELQSGQFVKKATDTETLFVAVDAVISDTSLTLVTPYAGTTSSTSGVVATVTTGARTVLTRFLLLLTSVEATLSGTGAAMTLASSSLTTALTKVREAKNSTVELYNDAADIVQEATIGSVELNGLSIARPSLSIGVGTSQVLYIAKVAGAVGAGIRVAQVAGGALSVVVAGFDVTVTYGAATTAVQAATAVAASSANTFLEVYSNAAGSGLLAPIALTNLSFNSLSGISDTDQSTLLRRFDRCKTEAASIQSSASTIQTNLDTSTVPALLVAQEQVALVGLDVVTTDTYLYSLEQARLALVAGIGAPSPSATGLYATTYAIDTSVLVLDTSGSVSNSVGAQLDNIFAHVNALLAADCQSNLVSVPVLTRDASGFYAPPTLGLQQALQVYLSARKEVTQTVKVSSGENRLIRPVIVIRAGVLTGYSLSGTKSAIEAASDGILKGRVFGASLFLSDFDGIKQGDAAVPGVSFLNVSILGYNDVDGVLQTAPLDLNVPEGSGKLDPNGNLIISSTEVISKETRTGLPSVTVTTELYTPSN